MPTTPPTPPPPADGTAGLALPSSLAAGRSDRLQITHVDLHYVSPPMQEGILSAAETHGDLRQIPKFVLKVHTDAGLVGLGETHRMRGGPDSEAAARLRRAAQEVRGCNVFDFDLRHLRLPVDTDTGAFEVALYDLVGKAVGWPMWRLLGGRVRSRIPVHYWAGKRLTMEEIRALGQRAVALGFAGVKMKRSYPLVEALQTYADVSPDLKITVDLMGSYPDGFLADARQWQAVGNVLCIEDPPPGGHALDDYRRLRDELDIPIAMHGHINERGVRGMVDAIAAKACDVFNLGAGSTYDFLGRAYLAQEAGIPVWHGSAHELGILDAAILHACAAAPACTYPSDILSHQRVHDLLATPLAVAESCIAVPDGPGLGVELDDDALQRYAVR
ncbi:MAG: mandelate racemase/muconate lactonizing enzyme family protein [Candidatus Latescibacterota bacterium]